MNDWLLLLYINGSFGNGNLQATTTCSVATSLYPTNGGHRNFHKHPHSQKHNPQTKPHPSQQRNAQRAHPSQYFCLLNAHHSKQHSPPQLSQQRNSQRAHPSQHDSPLEAHHSQHYSLLLSAFRLSAHHSQQQHSSEIPRAGTVSVLLSSKVSGVPAHPDVHKPHTLVCALPLLHTHSLHSLNRLPGSSRAPCSCPRTRCQCNSRHSCQRTH